MHVCATILFQLNVKKYTHEQEKKETILKHNQGF